MYLNDTEKMTLYHMNIPKCGTPCRLKTLTRLWKDVLPENWDDECLLLWVSPINTQNIYLSLYNWLYSIIYLTRRKPKFSLLIYVRDSDNAYSRKTKYTVSCESILIRAKLVKITKLA